MLPESDVDRNFAQAVGARTLHDALPGLARYLPGTTGRILDIGCGPGNITADVARAAARSMVVGVDPVTYHIELACTKRTTSGSGNLHFAIAHGERLLELALSESWPTP